MLRVFSPLVCLIVLMIGPAVARDLPPAASGKVDYETQIKPIFVAKCLDCHGEDTQEGKFRLDRKTSLIRGGDSGEPAILPGNSGESHLIHLVARVESGLAMPPDESDRLTPDEVGLLRAWVDQGANWPGPDGVVDEEAIQSDHWSFQPLAAVPVPDVRNGRIQNPIDAFVLQTLEQKQLHQNPAADRRTLIRRIYLDALGLPPSPEQIQAYVDDPSEDATAKLVDQVLASPHFGERQARYWLDLVRFAETHGFETNRERPTAWVYRDYVIRSFNADKPYDQFVKEQIAGDLYGDVNGLGYLVAGAYDLVKSPDINLTLMQRHNELDDMINTTGTVFLGLTLGCARCHNHKFDPISQTDYYAMQAIFSGVGHGEMALPLPADQERQLKAVEAKMAELEQQLRRFPRPRSTAQLVLIDDSPEAAGFLVETLQQPSGVGVNPAGTQRGEKSDAGGQDRVRNVSNGKYTWWNHTPDQAVMGWGPQVTGEYRLWLSWGCGFESHCQDARYVIDRDGNPLTSDDWEEVASVNQQFFADGVKPSTARPLWSGFYNAGVVTLEGHQKILLVGGKTGKALTADAILLEGLEPGDAGSPRNMPRFRDPLQASGNIDEFPSHPARFVRFRIDGTNSGQPCLDELEVFSGDRNVALAANGGIATASGSLSGYAIHKLEHINDGRYGNKFSWISNEPGGGWVQIEFPKLEMIDRVVWGRDREGHFLDRLATRYFIESSTDGQNWERLSSHLGRLPIDNSRKQKYPDQFDHLAPPQARAAKGILKELEMARDRREQLSVAPKIYAGIYSQPGPTHRLFRGEPLMKREEVNPGVPAVFASLNLPADLPEKERRKALVEWITSPDNPLTARVMVNRIWQSHFGKGLVDTASDFGASGALPTHPELLDWLAGELMAQNWSMKQIHRLILNSATYQQSSLPVTDALAQDAGTLFLWRYPPQRLEAEPIRDSILSVTGVLELKPGGPGFSLFEIEAENVRHYYPKTTFGPEEWRRMIYMTKVRMEQDSVFGVFDCPDAATSVARRTVSTTPLQALNLFNSEFLMQQADLFAARLTREHPENSDAQIRRAFELCYGRPAANDEVELAAGFISEAGLPAFCRAMLNSNEFLFLQ